MIDHDDESQPQVKESGQQHGDVARVNFAVHPSLDLSRQYTTDIDRQNINIRRDLADDIMRYLRRRQDQPEFDTSSCLRRHEAQPLEDCIDAEMRARMVDWMIEVLTNFKCDDQTFFLAVSLMDRYFKKCGRVLQINDLHGIGVTAMFVASKFEDIYPIKMRTVHEKIAHKKLTVDAIKSLELNLMLTIEYKVHAPTPLDFLKQFLLDILGIRVASKSETKQKLESALEANRVLHEKRASGELPPPSDTMQLREDRFDPSNVRMSPLSEEEQIEDLLIEKMSIYLAKMAMHDYALSSRSPSLLGIGAIYVALKICE